MANTAARLYIRSAKGYPAGAFWNTTAWRFYGLLAACLSVWSGRAQSAGPGFLSAHGRRIAGRRHSILAADCKRLKQFNSRPAVVLLAGARFQLRLSSASSRNSSKLDKNPSVSRQARSGSLMGSPTEPCG